MPSSRVRPARPTASRRRRWLVLAPLLCVLGMGGWWGWRWFQQEAMRQDALSLLEQHRFEAAEPLLLRLLERHPDDIDVLRLLAVEYIRARRLDEAEAMLGRWCSLRPDDVEPHRQRFDLLMKQQRLAEAATDAEQLLRLQPDQVEIRRTLIPVLYLSGRHQEAERECLACLRAQPDNANLRLLLGRSYRLEGRTAEAVEQADQLLRATPDSVGAILLRADLYMDAGQLEPAIRLLQQAADRPGPEGVSALYQLSMVLDRAGRAEESKKAVADMRCLRAKGLWSSDSHRDDNIGLQSRVVEALVDAGKADEAARFLEDILKRNPNASGARQLLDGLGRRPGGKK